MGLVKTRRPLMVHNTPTRNMIKYLKMKLAIAMLAAPCAAEAAEFVVPALPPPQGCVAEASTNIVIGSGAVPTRSLGVTLSLVGRGNACLQVAFGRGADMDGDLAPEETSVVLGWRRGRWFVEDAQTGERVFEQSETGWERRTLSMGLSFDKSGCVESAAFASDEGACFAGLAALRPGWLSGTDWTLAKVTRRGVTDIGDTVSVERKTRSFSIILR